MKNLGGIVIRAKLGEVAPAELAEVATELTLVAEGDFAAEMNRQAVYRMVYVLGRNGAHQYTDLLARFWVFLQDLVDCEILTYLIEVATDPADDDRRSARASLARALGQSHARSWDAPPPRRHDSGKNV